MIHHVKCDGISHLSIFTYGRAAPAPPGAVELTLRTLRVSQTPTLACTAVDPVKIQTVFMQFQENRDANPILVGKDQ